jgi:hypothetical protein
MYQNTFDDCDIFEKAAQLNVSNQDITESVPLKDCRSRYAKFVYSA